jgi:hypothetical protein
MTVRTCSLEEFYEISNQSPTSSSAIFLQQFMKFSHSLFNLRLASAAAPTSEMLGSSWSRAPETQIMAFEVVRLFFGSQKKSRNFSFFFRDIVRMGRRRFPPKARRTRAEKENKLCKVYLKQ